MRSSFLLIAPATLLACSMVPRPVTAAQESAAEKSTPAQPANTPESPTLTSLRILAVDDHGAPVSDLKADELQLRINKTEQKIVSLTPAAEEPMMIGLFFDISGSRSLNRSVGKEIAAATGFLHSVWRPGDAGFVVAFNDKIYPLAEPTDKLQELEQALDRLIGARYFGPTALYDAICSVHVDIKMQTKRTTLFIIFSDFADNTSHHSREAAIEQVRSDGAYVFPILFDPEVGRYIRSRSLAKDIDAARDLAEHSGGRLVTPSSEKDLAPQFQLLADELKGAYRIRFAYPANLGKKHKFEVKTTRPDVRLLYAKD